MTEPQPGKYVTPAVRLTRALRRGGMGSVWLAHHEGLDTEVVVKFLMTSLSGDEQNRERFMREAAAAAKVHSPHVVRIFDHGVCDDGQLFIVMEYLEGEDLGRLLRQRGALSTEEVAHIVEQTGRALDAAHKRGIIHRDVKPANIFLIDVGARLPHVKLVDFGVAKATQLMTLTSTGDLVGTPVYMSPEQIAGKELDHRSDLWSLGVVAFRGLTAERPFTGDTIAAVTYQVMHGALPHPSDHKPELPRAVDGWFARACAHEHDERFDSARAMADALWEAIEMPQAASSWSGASYRVDPSVADTVPQRGPTKAKEPTTARGKLSLTGEQTAGSLGSAVSTVTPPDRSRWRSIAVAVALPLALAAGYGLATLRPDESAPAAAPATGDTDVDDGLGESDRSDTSAAMTSTAAPATDSTNGTDAGATSASASAAPVEAKPRPTRRAPRRVPVSEPSDSPDDLGF